MHMIAAAQDGFCGGRCLPASAGCGGPAELGARPALRRAALFMQEQQPQPKWWQVDQEKLQETAGTFVGTFIKEAEKSANNWVNSGWQVKKRAGQVIGPRPRAIRPPPTLPLGRQVLLLLLRYELSCAYGRAQSAPYIYVLTPSRPEAGNTNWGCLGRLGY